MPQPAPFNTIKAYAVFALEQVSGVPETLDAADHDMRLRQDGLELSHEMATYMLAYASGDHTVAGAVPGMETGGINFNVDLQAASSGGIAPRWMKAAMFTGHRQEARIEYSVDLSASNSAAVSLAVDWGTPVAITPVSYTTSHTNTMNLLKAALETAGGPGTVVTVGGTSGRTLFITHPTKVMSVTSAAVTGGTTVTTTLSTWVVEDGTRDFVTATGKFFLVPPTGNPLVVTLKGLHGSSAFGFENTGEPVTMRVSNMMGAVVGIETAAGLPLTNFDTTEVPNTLGITLTDGAIAVYTPSLIVDGGHSVEMIPSGQEASGAFAAHTATRAPRLRWNRQVDSSTSDPVWARLRAGTKTAVAFSTGNSGLKIKLNVRKIQPLNLPRTSRNGLDSWDQECLIVKDPVLGAYEIGVSA